MSQPVLSLAIRVGQVRVDCQAASLEALPLFLDWAARVKSIGFQQQPHQTHDTISAWQATLLEFPVLSPCRLELSPQLILLSKRFLVRHKTQRH